MVGPRAIFLETESRHLRFWSPILDLEILLDIDSQLLLIEAVPRYPDGWVYTNFDNPLRSAFYRYPKCRVDEPFSTKAEVAILNFGRHLEFRSGMLDQTYV